MWKKSIFAPFAKTTKPTSLNDLRPVSLMSLATKTFEKLIKKEILEQVEKLDPLQFAYRPCRGVDDAVITLINFLNTEKMAVFSVH